MEIQRHADRRGRFQCGRCGQSAERSSSENVRLRAESGRRGLRRFDLAESLGRPISQSVAATDDCHSTGIGSTSLFPDKVGDFDPAGSTVVFQTALDDYAEIWVNGEISRFLGQKGGSVVAGWNAPNRLVIGRDVKPGQKIQLAVFGINGPISNPPTNFIWVREAKLDFYKGETPGPIAITPSEVNVDVVRLDEAINKIVGPNPKLFKLAEGFKFTEGPVWVGDGLLFSDPNANTIYKYSKDGSSAFSKRRADTLAPTSPNIDSRARTGSRSIRKGTSSSISTAIAASFDLEKDGSESVRRGQIRRQAIQFAERSRLSIRRHAVLHGSELRSSEIRRRSAKGVCRTPAFIRSTKVRFNS